MLLGCKNEVKGKLLVELVRPPAGCIAGDRVLVQDVNTPGAKFESCRPKGQVNAKKKNHAWRKSMPGLKTNAQRQATYQGHVLLTDKGPCLVKTLANSQLC